MTTEETNCGDHSRRQHQIPGNNKNYSNNDAGDTNRWVKISNQNKSWKAEHQRHMLLSRQDGWKVYNDRGPPRGNIIAGIRESMTLIRPGLPVCHQPCHEPEERFKARHQRHSPPKMDDPNMKCINQRG